MAQTFKVNGKTYEIAYNIKRMKMYENSNPPIMSTYSNNGGHFTIGQLEAIIAYGLRLEGGEWVSPSEGMQMAENLIEANGYVPMLSAVTEAIARDCAFFFAGV